MFKLYCETVTVLQCGLRAIFICWSIWCSLKVFLLTVININLDKSVF